MYQHGCMLFVQNVALMAEVYRHPSEQSFAICSPKCAVSSRCHSSPKSNLGTLIAQWTLCPQHQRNLQVSHLPSAAWCCAVLCTWCHTVRFTLLCCGCSTCMTCRSQSTRTCNSQRFHGSVLATVFAHLQNLLMTVHGWIKTPQMQVAA